VSASTYRLQPEEPLPEGIMRIAGGRIDHALDELRGNTESTPEEAVHEARKDLKKLRALLRLARGELGKSTFTRENACFRDAGRELAGAREFDAMLTTLETLDLPAGPAVELRNAIQSHGGSTGSGSRSAAAGRAAGMLVEARGRVDAWPLERDSFGALGSGLERTYRRGRRDFKAVRAHPSVEGLHEWRKRVKELWYHHTLMRSLWPPVMEAVGDQVHELADRLGEDHDLATLADWVREHAETGPELFDAVERHRSRLQGEALGLGARVYAERPGAYVRRLRRLWEAGPTFIRAP
jgi:CHAD domain-containing protein